MKKWIVATLARCVIVEAENESDATIAGCMDLTELCGRPIMPDMIRTCQEATLHEIALHTLPPATKENWFAGFQ